MGSGKTMRKLISLIILLLLLFLAVEIASTFIGQWAVSRRLQAKYSLSQSPSVSISSFPMVYNLAKGRIRSLSVSMENQYLIRKENDMGFPVMIYIFARDINFSWNELIMGKPSLNYIGELRSIAVVDEDILSSYLSNWEMAIEWVGENAFIIKSGDSSKKYQCKVQVKSNKVVELIISKVSISNPYFLSSEGDIETGEVKAIDFSLLPDGFNLENACLKRGKLLLYISIKGL